MNQGARSEKDWTVALILVILLGTLGVHRFYAGKIGTGILMLLTGGGCYIWWIIDIVSVATGKFTDEQGLPIQKPAQGQ